MCRGVATDCAGCADPRPPHRPPHDRHDGWALSIDDWGAARRTWEKSRGVTLCQACGEVTDRVFGEGNSSQGLCPPHTRNARTREKDHGSWKRGKDRILRPCRQKERKGKRKTRRPGRTARRVDPIVNQARLGRVRQGGARSFGPPHGCLELRRAGGVGVGQHRLTFTPVGIIC